MKTFIFHQEVETLTISNQHTETEHGGTYPCEQCDFVSTTPTALVRHSSIAHQNIIKKNINENKNQTVEGKQGYKSKRRKCEFCDKKFNKRETFNKHQKEAHQITENININMSKEKSTRLETKSNSNLSNIQMAFQRQLRSQKRTDSVTNVTIN